MTSFSAVQVRDLKLCPHLVPVTDSLAASKQAVSLHARQACLLQASKLLHAALSLQLWQKPIWSTPYTPGTKKTKTEFCSPKDSLREAGTAFPPPEFEGMRYDLASH